MFVSTVRSRHHVAELADSASEFGFLSEEKLVNTALTRAKSWLAVVGDPVALCSVGSCGSLWRTYLKHCQKVGGIHPTDLSLEDIWQQSQSLMNLLTVNTLGQARHNPVSQSPSHVFQLVTTTSAETNLPAPSVIAEMSFTQPVGIGSQTNKVTAPQAVYSGGAKAADRQAISAEGAEVGTRQTASMMQRAVAPEGHSTSVVRTIAHDRQTTLVERVKAHDRLVSEEVVSSDVDSYDSPDKSDTRLSSNSVDAVPPAYVISFSEWSLDYQLEPDEIIRQLAKVRISSWLHFSSST